jgi:protein-S-isoprenylcysteine O-methyltransferase Ste14
MQTESQSVVKRTGLARLIYDLKHNRRRFRQFLGIMFLILVTVVGTPDRFPAELYVIGATLAVIGIAIRLWASGHVKKDKVLATTGPYAYVRHPLYVGNHLIMVGFCLASGLWWSFIVYIAFSLYFYPQTIRHEDSVLQRLFPGQWEPWAKETRALIPRLTPYRSGETAQWSFKQSLRANGEPIIAAFLVWFLYILYTGSRLA